jgi:UDP-glucose 4-epimerase
LKALITGGAGFIGSHLVDALVTSGDTVVVLDDLSTGNDDHVSPSASFFLGSVTDEEIVRDAVSGCDVVFHLAAQADVQASVRNPGYDARVNVVGTVCVLHAAALEGCPVVFASTGGAMYGECDVPAAEDTPPCPVSPYGMSKHAAEGYVLGWNRVHDTANTVLRLANVYGPRQSVAQEGGVVAIFLDHAMRGERCTIYGDGEQTRDMLYVTDAVAAFLAAAGNPGVFNVGTGVGSSVNDLHRWCTKAAFVTSSHVREPARIGDVQHSVLDATKAHDLLGWTPLVSVEEGIQRIPVTPA